MSLCVGKGRLTTFPKKCTLLERERAVGEYRKEG